MRNRWGKQFIYLANAQNLSCFCPQCFEWQHEKVVLYMNNSDPVRPHIIAADKLLLFVISIPRHTIVAGYYGFTLDVRVSVCPSVVHPSVFRFRMITSKSQWIFIKLGMCIDIVEIWFGIANGQILSMFDGVICPRHAHIWFWDDNLSKHQWIFTKLGVHWYCEDLVWNC